MPRLLCLDASFLAAFRRKLHGGLVLGVRLSSRKLTPCRLGVWVPDEMDAIAPADLDRDLLSSPFNIDKELEALLDSHFLQPNALAIADTSRRFSDPKPGDCAELAWFSCAPVKDRAQPYLCAAVCQSRASPLAYRLLLREASPYTTVLTLATLPPGMELSAEMHLDSKQVDALLERVQHLLVGALDECSMLLWSRVTAPGPLLACPEISD